MTWPVIVGICYFGIGFLFALYGWRSMYYDEVRSLRVYIGAFIVFFLLWPMFLLMLLLTQRERRARLEKALEESVYENFKEFVNARNRKVNRKMVDEFGGLKINYPTKDCLQPEDIENGWSKLSSEKRKHLKHCQVCKILANFEDD